MPETAPRRVVVFDRIDSNRRATLLLAGISGLAMIPVDTGVSPYFAFWVVLYLPGLSDFMQDTSKGITAYIVLIVSIPLILVAGAIYLQHRYADRIALRMARAQPLARDRERRLWDTAEGLCLGTGLPLPKLYVVETEVPNAYSVGLTPGRSSIVVTRGPSWLRSAMAFP